MTLAETMLKDAILIDADAGIEYYSDQAFVNYPVRFPVVNIMLQCTDALCEVADTIRKQEGHIPLLDSDNGWYNFYTDLNGFTDTNTSCIVAIVDCPDADDDGQEYVIELSEAGHRELYKILDRQLKEKTGMGCQEHLSEAAKENVPDLTIVREELIKEAL